MDDLGAFFEMSTAAGTADDAVQLGLAAPVHVIPASPRKAPRRAVWRSLVAAVAAWLFPLRTGPPARAFI